MKYISPTYKREEAQAEDIMAFSANNIKTEQTTFDFGNGLETVTKGTSTVGILDLLFN
ncbi:MAG: hypothetical protein IKB27_04260 [Clostridia bacterium]|nr:hypothetical protein [Clostridia bacterium]MBR2444593.1 hypothetical protein [Clostridia bacterium]